MFSRRCTSGQERPLKDTLPAGQDGHLNGKRQLSSICDFRLPDGKRAWGYRVAPSCPDETSHSHLQTRRGESPIAFKGSLTANGFISANEVHANVFPDQFWEGIAGCFLSLARLQADNVRGPACRMVRTGVPRHHGLFPPFD